VQEEVTESEHADHMWEKNEMSLKQEHKTLLKSDHLANAEGEGSKTLLEVTET
jgi:hypothetical protein